MLMNSLNDPALLVKVADACAFRVITNTEINTDITLNYYIRYCNI
jgi:hypothetical protein